MTNPTALTLTTKFFLILSALTAGASLVSLGVALLARSELNRQERYRRLDDVPAEMGVHHAR